MKNKLISAGLVAALCLSLAGCGSSSGNTSSTSTSGETTATSGSGVDLSTSGAAFKLGGSGPLSGDASVYGIAVKNAAELAISEINAKGGVQFEFNFQDDQADTEAAVNAYTDQRNARTVGVIVGATYDASQKQAADATSGATYDVLMYNTIRKAIKLLRGLKDVQTKEKIAVPSITLLCNSADRWDIERVINGQLGSGNGTIGSLNMQSLPIDTIIEYDHGITHGKKWGKKTLSFPGVTQGKAYLFVPGEAFFVAVKRPLTMETGRGSVLQLSTEEKAWYAVQAEHYKDFLGSSYPGTSVGAGFGYIVEVTLPVEA